MLLYSFTAIPSKCTSSHTHFLKNPPLTTHSNQCRIAMIKKPQTVGELFEHFQKVQFDRSSRAASQAASKLEHIDDDFILSYSNSEVKTQAKLEQGGLKVEQEQTLPVPKSRQVCQLLTIRESSRPNDVVRIKLDFYESPGRKKIPKLHFQQFRHKDVWDSQRSLRLKIRSDSIKIHNLVQLPPEKHRLNAPRPYKPLEPMKKKMYRPAVPRMFKSGYDEFLERRKRNASGEVDLGVWSVDQVLEQCYKRDLIPLATYNQFINTNGHLQIRRFLQAWQGGELGIYDFKRSYFTLLDHRRLSELLLHCYPQYYTRGSIEALHADVKEFISATYRLNSDDYAESYLLLDEISECTWWADLKARLDGDPEHASYFRLKECINKPPLPAQMQYDKHSKSQYIRDLLGPIAIQDSQVELEKILSMKHKSNKSSDNQNRDDATSYHRNDEDEEFESSHDRTEITSQHSAHGQGQKSRSGPDWDVFEDD